MKVEASCAGETGLRKLLVEDEFAKYTFEMAQDPVRSIETFSVQRRDGCPDIYSGDVVAAT